MQRRPIIFAVALGVVTGVIACGNTDETTSAVSPKLPTPLIDVFSSHQPTAEIEDALRRSGKRITVEDGVPRATPSKVRPPLSIRVVRVSPFELWGCGGDLRLEFVDGALSSTWSYPSDPTKFGIEVKKRLLGAGRSLPLRLQPATELRSDVDYTGAKYWVWEDVNLRQKLDQWTKRNA